MGGAAEGGLQPDLVALVEGLIWPGTDEPTWKDFSVCTSLIQQHKARIEGVKAQRELLFRQATASARIREERIGKLNEILKNLEGCRKEQVTGGETGGGDEMTLDKLESVMAKKEYYERLGQLQKAHRDALVKISKEDFPGVLENIKYLHSYECPVEYSKLQDYLQASIRSAGEGLRVRLLELMEASVLKSGWPGTADLPIDIPSDIVKGLDLVSRTQEVLEEIERSQKPPWIVTLLAKPTLARFVYHFTGDRPTNDIERPEWYFSFVTQAIQLARPQFLFAISPAINPNKYQSDDSEDPFLFFFARELVLALRRKVRQNVEAVWSQEVSFCHLVEECIAFDKMLDEETSYSAGKSRFPWCDWPRAVDVLHRTDDRLARWVEVDLDLIMSKVKDSCQAEGAWEPLEKDPKARQQNSLRGQGLIVTESSHSFAGLFRYLTDRYRSLADTKLQMSLVTSVVKPMVMQYLYSLYDAAKACPVDKALEEGKDLWKRYCLVISTVLYAVEVLEDAANDAMYIKLEGVPSPTRKLEKKEKVLAAISNLSNKAADVTENISRTMEDPAMIIGPARVLTAAFSTIRGAARSHTEQVTPKSEEAKTPGKAVKEEDPSAAALARALELLKEEDDDEEGSTSKSIFAPDISHFRNLADAMISDAIDSFKVSFQWGIRTYFLQLGSIAAQSSSIRNIEQVSTELHGVLWYLETVLQIASEALESRFFLKFWQGIAYFLNGLLRPKIEGLKRVTLRGGDQISRDCEAIICIFSSYTQRSDRYFGSLKEVTTLLSSPEKTLLNLQKLLSELMDSSSLSSQSPAAYHMKAALEINGIFHLSAGEVLALTYQRSKASLQSPTGSSNPRSPDQRNRKLYRTDSDNE